MADSPGEPRARCPHPRPGVQRAPPPQAEPGRLQVTANCYRELRLTALFEVAAIGSTMITCAVAEHHLLLRFQEFYCELHRVRERSAGDAASAHASPQPVSSEALIHLLERQAAEMREALDDQAFEVYREAQYVMAALADDLYSHVDASDQPAWVSLEQRFFRANAAGEMFFQKLDDLLQGQDPEHIELAQLYFFAICLGFQGRYRNAHDLAPLLAYRQQLFDKVFSGQPALTRNDAPLMQLAPIRAVPDREVRSLPHPQVWLALPAGVLLLWVLFSFVFWTGFLRPITRMVTTPVHSNSADGR